MPPIGPHISIKTGIIADISTIVFNGDRVFLCKINGKVFKMTEEEFRLKWRKCEGKRGIR